MTAVLEPQAAGHSIPVKIHTEVPVQKVETSALDLKTSAAPMHCGMEMTAAPVPIASLGWAPLELGSSEWSCPCGYRMDDGPAGDPLDAVRLASARVESLQWELDAAQEGFANAVRSACRMGAAPDALGNAAGLTATELQEFLAGTNRLL
ncbi:hypothetical protein [Pseudarthrobacter sp. fls2-241-R2A-127]|uniref:hypothetical protein n=1 Tax=Pseudarthrobacter sp. fls2-241-R2A-127 TaxID=3040303 RepID=UPI00255480CD|nr:hypothetical protein [Pseudarthrobacter sp. fls2-241-R2A-127]